MENSDLKFLKKHYGENFAHLCRELFPTILEQEGVLSEIISSNFAQSRSLYDDIIEFKEEFQSYIYSFFKGEKKEEVKVDKTPTELLDEAGYILYPECQTEEEIQSFKKYWAPGEELCTFRGKRLESCRVWFAVKKNVDKIRREDFKNPQRQDEYGTSAISIQFSKGETSTLSIKNRYNHTVNNPDSTFGNDLEKIIPGLTQAFAETYGINSNSINSDFVNLLSFEYNYTVGNDGRIYKFSIENDDIHYCENNVILEHGHAVKLDKARYILAEQYIIDTQKNEVKLYKSDKKDSFIKSLGEIEKISIKTDEKGNKVVIFTPKTGKNVELTLNISNQMICYSNPNVKKIDDDFLLFTSQLEEVILPKLEIVKDGFLSSNKKITKLNFPNLKKVGNYFLTYNFKLSSIIAPKLREVGLRFLYGAENIEVIDLPNLTRAGGEFLYYDNGLTELDLPKLEYVEEDFLFFNERLTKLNLPNLKNTGICFLDHNTELEKLELPNLISVSNYFLTCNKKMKELYLPKIKEIPSFKNKPIFLNLNISQKIKEQILINKQRDEKEDLDKKPIEEETESQNGK